MTLLIQRGMVWYRASVKYPQKISTNIVAQRKENSHYDRRQERRKEH
ncbi:hypothetical protein [Companilactobacillus zhachilii]|nr:hypothetical protein [Companilactobacillus zhachilii]